MKQIITAGLVLLVLLILFPNFAMVIRSQSPEPTKAEDEFDNVYETYLDDIDTYDKAHNEYIFRRSQYLNFKTLKSQQEAQGATLVMLQTRDQVAISYLRALDVRLNNAIGVPQARHEGLNIRINEEVGWFLEHKDGMSSAGTLDDLVKESNLASNHYNLIQPLFYEVLAVISQGRIYYYNDRTDEMLSRVRGKVEQIRGEERDEYRFSSEKQQVLDRWMFESEGRFSRSKEKQVEVDAIVLDFIRKRGSLLTNYNSVVSKLGEAQLFLKESNTFILEIIREIKTAEDKI
ncbi:hypothetical protein A2863_02865 [Candidatus Woesebacteria bacterium RIFCSPHIGHO2_01_FULL_38_9b]|uniref:Uncharacterized protein n=1 Tax=Candidatus Woesebacteria bacterium RIFCSPHIGHO2_01_FULL_38_9b TaxID=1802493 RepID=A0A1F7Y4M2_9BACT|nr:MAG: hypothetical protein A2863_02865 [Candidatus Woesebacteria bacterium RIFCSPHIGHO2_01_FULL_38_9b]